MHSGKRTRKLWLLSGMILVLIISCIHPVYPHEMFLQHSATLIMTGFFTYVIFKDNLSDKSFLCLVLMVILHIIGARWIYTYTPYDKWIQYISGFSINQYFDLKRNHYDRFVHFMYGLLLIIPVSEVYKNWLKVPRKFSDHFAFLFVMSTSLIYELFEWGIAMALSPGQAEAYNGQQGDPWDAQKDMALAMAGAIVMLLIRRIWPPTITTQVAEEENQGNT